MSTQEPPGPEPEQQGGGPPSSEKRPPPGGGAGGGSPYEAAPPPSPYDAASPYGGYGGYGGYGEAGGLPPGMPPLGGRGRRLLARVIDGLLVSVVCALAFGWFVDWGSRNGEAALSVVTGLVYWVYESLMLSRDGQTVGKKITKVRVARLGDGAVPTSGEAWGRAAVYTLPSVLCCGLWVVVDGGWCLFDKPYRQCVHDKAVRTVVVSTRHG